jgi:hypothetical protein
MFILAVCFGHIVCATRGNPNDTLL